MKHNGRVFKKRRSGLYVPEPFYYVRILLNPTRHSAESLIRERDPFDPEVTRHYYLDIETGTFTHGEKT